MAKTIQDFSIDARAIYERLLCVAVGDEVSYAELTELIGRDVQQRARSILTTARRRAQRVDRMVFGTVRGVGLRRLNDEEIVGTAENARRHIRRSATRAAMRVTVVDFDKLPNDQKIKHNAMLSLFGVVASFASGSSVRKLEKSVTESGISLPLAKTLEALK